RRPLYDALHVLDDHLAHVFERSDRFVDPWAARDAYIHVLLEGDSSRPAFLATHVLPGRSFAQVWTLLEMQRFSMLMFTSCGWFFDDPARLETRQVLRYAGRALDLCPETESAHLREIFLEHLKPLRSNKYPELDGTLLFEDVVASSRMGLSPRISYEDVPKKETSAT
ncbi:MAG TPA: DUF3536 domain-containing protein, partial [Candidatus Eisenbacteria bacterium]|nr:DUF3536 domain-containing protein [Candidatus Eisenbacteria bacterium]